MTNNTLQNLADSFSKSIFQLSLGTLNWTSSMWHNKLTVANYDRQANIHCSLFQITICLLWRQTPLIKDVFHPASYTINHSLSRCRRLWSGDCAHRVMHSWDCTHVLRNLGILRMCNVISRLRKFSDCAELRHPLGINVLCSRPTWSHIHSLKFLWNLGNWFNELYDGLGFVSIACLWWATSYGKS